MYTQDELNKLIADVSKEFTSHLAKAEESFKLAKSEEFPPKKDESKEKDEKKPSDESKGESKKPIEEEKPEDKGVKDQHQQSEDKPGENDQAQPGQAAQAPAEGQDEGHGYDDEDMAHMHSMYSSMSKPELKAHHDAVRKCMDGKSEQPGMAKAELEDKAKDAQGYRPNGGPSDGQPEAEGKGPASSDTQALVKSEKSGIVEEISLMKSELEATKAKSEEYRKNLDAVEAFLKKFVEKTAPAGKAITSLDVIAKTESAVAEKPLQKGEIDAKLMAKAKDQSLSKSDREAINSYYCGGKNIEKVRHLLS